jgi:hypothetical protein
VNDEKRKKQSVWIKVQGGEQELDLKIRTDFAIQEETGLGAR